MRTACLALLVALVTVASAGAAPPQSPDVLAGTWIETLEGRATLVVALYRRTGSAGPSQAFVGCSVRSDQDGPGGYGVIPQGAWTEVALEAGALTRAQRPLTSQEQERPPAVLVLPAAPTSPVDVHTLIDGDVPASALLFARPARSTVVSVARHVLGIGETTEIGLAAPPAPFFLPETLEVAVVSRRLGLDGQEAESPSGFVRLVWLTPEGPPPAPAVELRGEAGERRVRTHFTDPKCAWAERHVGWMEARWVLEYAQATPLAFRLETDAVKRPGLVSDLWKGYGALSIEAIYPNGFGGSSANYDLPPVLVVPKGTPTRTVALR